ncbi:proline-serine-threonine phosphatase-interacting protein 1-like isoform X2 [Panulirus ornatus]|uniref:proline-serine-threonine phosphatase-interacting protein 1-like isoform X2 n=1 Tax=Panulirus ornatus TaxID=150431 RepID=UPI003A88776B
MGSIGNFAEEFWNVEVGNFGGWEIVSQRMKEASKITANYVDLLKQVAAAMDTFGRALLKSAKNSPLPDMEHGEMKASLETARVSVELWGQDTMEAAAAITAQAAQLTQHLAQAKDTRRLTEEEVKQRQQQVREAVRRVRQAQHLAQGKMRELMDAEVLKLTLITKPDTKSKDREKVTQVEERAMKATRDAEATHKTAVNSHNAALDNWCFCARTAFDNMQVMEESRVKLLRECMWNVANICSLLAVHIDQIYCKTSHPFLSYS